MSSGDLALSLVRGLLRAAPFLKPLAKASLDGGLRILLLPLGRARGPGRPVESPDLVQRADRLNQAAEEYFARFENPSFLLNKPFSDKENFAKRLFDMGVLFQSLQVTPGDTVVEIGAGSCWVSHFLNRFGCRTIAVDVSQTALELGRELFERDTLTNWELEPQFLRYDGHRIPLPDASCDRIVINDAFHHVPNQRELLSEMARILVPDGRVAMCEPGKGHSSTPQSRREVEETGVLENDIVVEDLAALAEVCGFAGGTVAVAGPRAVIEVDARGLGAFTRGRGFRRFWNRFCDVLEESHYLILYKDSPLATTRRPRQLAAEIRLKRPRRQVRARPASATRIRLHVRNVGDTRWLADSGETTGWTRLGAHLYRASDPPELLDFDWYRADLSRDVDPEEAVTLDLELPSLSQPGSYLVELDLVVEGLTWFHEKGSRVCVVQLVVR